MIQGLLLPTPPRTWDRRTGDQLKTWATTVKVGLEPSPDRKSSATHDDWVKASSELMQEHRALSASIRDVVSSIGDAGSTRPG